MVQLSEQPVHVYAVTQWWPATIAAGPAGDVHVVYLVLDDLYSQGGEIFYRRWDGISWSAEEQLTSHFPDVSVWPRLATDATGNLHLAWCDGRGGDWGIYYKRWDGVSWTTDERVADHSSASTADAPGKSSEEAMPSSWPVICSGVMSPSFAAKSLD